MAITVWCPHPGCGQEFDVRDAARGLHVPCPACHRAVPIAAPAEPPPLPEFAPPRQPLAPPPLPRPAPRPRRRRFRGVRRAFGRRGASPRFGREEPKSRHGCVTVWLILIILANCFLAVVGLIARQRMAWSFPTETSWTIPVMTVLCLSNVLCAIALLNWKLWGFIGMCIVSATVAGLNLHLGAPIAQVAGNVLGPAILFGVLQMGDRRSTWKQLD